MKKIALLFLGFMIFGCTSMKNTQTAKNDKSGKHILPPNVKSNKYAKSRQGG